MYLKCTGLGSALTNRTGLFYGRTTHHSGLVLSEFGGSQRQFNLYLFKLDLGTQDCQVRGFTGVSLFLAPQHYGQTLFVHSGRDNVFPAPYELSAITDYAPFLESLVRC